jgi:carbonic anhydrase/acetyltransferase-like protein (isoleucine patch superfamily)
MRPNLISAFMPIYALGDDEPDIHEEAFVHPDATVIGRVRLGAGSTVWPGAVLRGDYGSISVGERTSVQDGTVVHAIAELDTVIGSDVVIGHLAHLEGCVVEDWALVGSGSVVLHRCVIGSHAVVGANAVVPNNTKVPARAMALGVPCVIKEDRVPEFANRFIVSLYVENGRRYARDLRKLS